MAIHTVAAAADMPASVFDGRPESTMNVRMAITDTGYVELQEENQMCVHYRLVIPPRLPLAEPLPYGMTFRCTGSDRWLPMDSVVVDVERTVRTWSEGWEWRKESCNGRVLEYWWVPAGCIHSFGDFHRDLLSA